MCGCVDVWMCGCADVQMCSCADVWMCGCADVQLCGCAVISGLLCLYLFPLKGYVDRMKNSFLDGNIKARA